MKNAGSFREVCIIGAEEQMAAGGPEGDGLGRARDQLMDHVHMRANLPALLARLAKEGHPDKALDALVAWGTGVKSVSELWKEVVVWLNKGGEPGGGTG